jgi:hypothetical protein
MHEAARDAAEAPRGLLVLLVGLALAGAAPAAAAEHRLGWGLHAWRTVDELAHRGDRLEPRGVSGVFSYQYVPSWPYWPLRLEADLEYFDPGFGGARTEAYAPQAFVVLGERFYGALGGGILYSDSIEGKLSDSFLAARVGWDQRLASRLHLDVALDYRFADWARLWSFSPDNVTVGAALRVTIGTPRPPG